jgi:hypothetical protein
MCADLKDLNVLRAILCPSRSIDLNPFVYDSFYTLHGKPRQREIMSRVINQYITSAMDWLDG